MDADVFQFIGKTVTGATDKFVQPAAERLMLALKILTTSSAATYITLTGYAIATGAIESPFWTFIKRCIKIVIISYFALTIDGYINGVMVAISNLESGLSQAMSGGDAQTSIYQLFDLSLGKGLNIVAHCFERGTNTGFKFGKAVSWFIAGSVIALCTILVTLLGGAVIIVAKFSLAVMFALGPLFIVSLMFPITARFFDSWFSQVLNYVITIVIMAIIMTFAMATFDGFISDLNLSGNHALNGPEEINPVVTAMQVAAVTGVLCWIILQAGGMASGLAGGISMAAMSIRHLMAPVAVGLGAAKRVADIFKPNSSRPKMGPSTPPSARGTSRATGGNTAWNPAYRQHAMSTAGRNVGTAPGAGHVPRLQGPSSLPRLSQPLRLTYNPRK